VSTRQPKLSSYRRYERLVVGSLVRRSGDAELAADLTAEVFAAAYLAAPRFRDGPEPAGAWLLAIARNKLSKTRRRARGEESAPRRLAMERVEFSDAELAAIDELGEVSVIDLLDELPPEQRVAVRRPGRGGVRL
jgi:DNA-directed RNA polymerase specialized sigma24 family protein